MESEVTPDFLKSTEISAPLRGSPVEASVTLPKMAGSEVVCAML
jgi:hypothetical protein